MVISDIAPGLIGDQAQGLFYWPPLNTLDQQQRWQQHDMRRVGGDLRMTLLRTTDITQ